MAQKTRDKILVIDDHPTTHRVLEKMLSVHGFEFIGAFDGAEGLIKATEQPPDLILMDILVPGMDGRELTRRIKQSPRAKNIPIVFITSTLSKREDKMDKFVEVDGVSYPAFAKPLYQPKLLSVIRKAIKASRKKNL
jgi:CheY-like chemotaxis protein